MCRNTKYACEDLSFSAVGSNFQYGEHFTSGNENRHRTLRFRTCVRLPMYRWCSLKSPTSINHNASMTSSTNLYQILLDELVVQG